MDYNQELKEGRSRVFKTRLVYFGAIAAAALFGFLYIFFATAILRFSEVSIAGNTALKREDLFAEKNPYLFQKIIVQNPLVASFEANKSFWNKKLDVVITERESYAVWCDMAKVNVSSSSDPGSSKCFWIDKDGLIFTHAPQSEGALVKSIYDYSGNELKIGSYAASPDLLNKIFEVFTVADKTGLEITKYSLKSLETKELHARTREGAEIYFNLRLNQNFTYEPLKALKGELQNLQYIDLRSENRVFYK